MWVFGYGSLMWDDWHVEWGCSHQEIGMLSGYRRAFNKASVENWGSHKNPGPTLNLESQADGSCQGIAFEFPEKDRDAVLAYLKRREGPNFPLRTVPVRLASGRAIDAIVPIYDGPNLIESKSIEGLVAMIKKARGTYGSCSDYLKGIAERLAGLGIDDPAVCELWTALKAKE